MHTYVKERQHGGAYLYTVGYWQVNSWMPLKDFNVEEQAQSFVNYLNGGRGDLFFQAQLPGTFPWKEKA